ncbi:hypothetical protein ACQ4M3_11055 [Leptolyngbya sp. AN03gr2]|uniref:hypothetical protein n=1 Tax=unclassified Leptolyngbya TaxID=2650499 RepID=UPI003D317B2D
MKPSELLHDGIQIEEVDGLNLFRFTPALQARSGELLEQKKLRSLSPEEQAELDSISELSDIFSYANYLLIGATVGISPPPVNYPIENSSSADEG